MFWVRGCRTAQELKLRGRGHEPWGDWLNVNICIYSDEVREFGWSFPRAGLGMKLSGIVEYHIL